MIIKSFDLYSIDIICEKLKLTNYSLNKNGSIDIDGDVRFPYKHELNLLFKEDINSFLDLKIKFNNISGHFSCDSSGIRNFDGCPEYVGRNFNTGGNKINSLLKCPKYIGGDFYVSSNRLRSMDGCPSVNRNIYCSNNYIKEFGTTPFRYKELSVIRNPIHEIYSLNKSPEFIECLIENKAIRVGYRSASIVKSRLIRSLKDSDGIIPESFSFKNYQII